MNYLNNVRRWIKCEVYVPAVSGKVRMSCMALKDSVSDCSKAWSVGEEVDIVIGNKVCN